MSRPSINTHEVTKGLVEVLDAYQRRFDPCHRAAPSSSRWTRVERRALAAMQPEQPGREGTVEFERFLQRVHDRVVPAAVARHDRPKRRQESTRS